MACGEGEARGLEVEMVGSRGVQEVAEGGPYSAIVECGPYLREADVAGLGERDVTRGAFLTFAALVDDPETDPDELEEFLSVTIVETGQLWVYPSDVFLQNLLHRRGDQSKVRRALDRLAPQEGEGEPDNA